MQFPANAKNTCHIHLPCPSNKNTSLQVVISRGFLNLHSRNVQLIQFYRVLVYALGKGMCTMCLSNLQITRESTSHSSRLPFTHTEFTHPATGGGIFPSHANSNGFILNAMISVTKHTVATWFSPTVLVFK